MPWKSPSSQSGVTSPSRFNGATAFMPWKSEDFERFWSVYPRLQWGHGFYAVEMKLHDTKKESDGLLQWGHGFYAVEMTG